MEEQSNDRKGKLHIPFDLKRFILFISDKKFTTRIGILKFFEGKM